jgi:L-lactate dehydrogenase complex protein LldG
VADGSTGTARAEILGRIRTALEADRGRREPDPIPRDYDHTRGYADRIALATDRITDYRATVTRCVADELPDRIRTVLTRRGARTMAAPVDLPAEWQIPGLNWHLDDPPLTIGQLDDSDGVITGCAIVIAETGTIVLDAGSGQGRRVLTLVPDYHLCVVRTDQIVTTVPEAFARLSPRPLTFISGPSATSDIELERVEGVHGPRTLDVLITG